MGASLNYCEFIGNVGKDPETRQAGAHLVASFSVACSKAWTDRDSGERKEKTEWVRCIAWRKTAEVVQQYVRKGTQVFVEGELETRSYEDKDGQTRYSTEIILSRVLLLGKRDNSGQEAGGQHGGGTGAQGGQQGGRAARDGYGQGRPLPPDDGHWGEADNDSLPF